MATKGLGNRAVELTVEYNQGDISVLHNHSTSVVMCFPSRHPADIMNNHL